MTGVERLGEVVRQLTESGAHVVMFTAPDIAMTPVLRSIRGRVAIYNCNLAALARRHDAIVAVYTRDVAVAALATLTRRRRGAAR